MVCLKQTTFIYLSVSYTTLIIIATTTGIIGLSLSVKRYVSYVSEFCKLCKWVFMAP